MPTLSCTIATDARRHELQKHGTLVFPCGCYITNVGSPLTPVIPWHWHEEVEMLVAYAGAFKLELIGQSHIVREGEGAFINSSVLQAGTKIGDKICEIRSFVFHPSIIAGMMESVYEQRYVRPLLECARLPGIHLHQDVPWHMEAVRGISDAFEACQSEAFGYELRVREKLSSVWFQIISHNRELVNERQAAGNTDAQRIKAMLAFIHAYYAESIGLRDIADAAAVSQRECLRCFKRSIGVSPIQYLLRHRISVAAGLLTTTGLNITEICRQAGFESPSYFSLTFKKQMDMSPKDYRKIAGGAL